MITLREITPENFRECIGLKVAEDQKYFVATNVASIAQSKVWPELIPLAVYHDDEMVGFTLHGKDRDDDKYWIARIMIDEKFQGKGYGKGATLALLERLRGYEDCAEVFLSFVPANEHAAKLYEKVGFENTGETDEDGEIIMRYDVQGSRTPA